MQAKGAATGVAAKSKLLSVFSLLLLSAPACGPAPLRSGQLIVWVSSRQGRYSADVEMSFAKDFPNATLVERQKSPETFLSQLKADPPQEPPPDIAFIGNYRQLEPLLKSGSVWLDWGQPRFAPGGWWVIFKNTRHLPQARAFVRWLSEDPGWQKLAERSSMSAETTAIVRDASISAAQAIINRDRTRLDTLLDADAARGQPGFGADPMDSGQASPAPGTQVQQVRPLLISGNSRLAFSLVTVVASGDSFYGLGHMLFIFRNEGKGWRILHINPNANIPVASGDEGDAPTAPQLKDFESRVASDEPEAPPPVAELVDPPDRAVWTSIQVPEISWRSQAAATTDFIVEWQARLSSNESNWFSSTLNYTTFAQISHTTQPFRHEAPRIGTQPHRWRIWTVGRSGAVSISPWRILTYR